MTYFENKTPHSLLNAAFRRMLILTHEAPTLDHSTRTMINIAQICESSHEFALRFYQLDSLKWLLGYIHSDYTLGRTAYEEEPLHKTLSSFATWGTDAMNALFGRGGEQKYKNRRTTKESVRAGEFSRNEILRNLRLHGVVLSDRFNPWSRSKIRGESYCQWCDITFKCVGLRTTLCA